MRAGNTANSLRPKQVEEGVSGTQRVQGTPFPEVTATIPAMELDTIEVKFKELVETPIVLVNELGPVEGLIAEIIPENAQEEVWMESPTFTNHYLLTIIGNLAKRISDLEVRATLYNQKASHKL